MTVSTLKNVDPSRFASFGFDGAEPYVANAAEYFHSDVERVVTSGHAWSGEGQPQAAAVVATNALALNTAKLQMQAGATAVGALTTAITKAQRDLLTTLDSITAKDQDPEISYTVAEDGTVTISTVQYENTAGGNPVESAPAEVTQETFQLQAALNYAETADLTASALLNRIHNSCPVFSANVSPRALAYNQTVHDLASENLTMAKFTEKFWENTTPTSLAGPTQGAWSAFFEGAVGSVTGTFPFFQQSDGFSLLEYLDGLGKGALKRFWWVGVGWMLYDGIDAADLKNRLPELDEPTNLLANKPGVDDSSLQELIDAAYLDPDSAAALAGFPTVAEAARLQGAGGRLGGDDYVAQARELRAQVQEWLAGSYDELDDDATTVYITQEVPYAGSTTQEVRVEAPHTLEYYDPEDFAVSPEDRAVARHLLQDLDAAVAAR